MKDSLDVDAEQEPLHHSVSTNILGGMKQYINLEPTSEPSLGTRINKNDIISATRFYRIPRLDKMARRSSNR